MTTLELHGRITETGNLEVQLPAGLPPGGVTVHIDLPSTPADWDQQPWTDEEIQDLLHPEPSSFAQLVAWLDTNPPTQPWADLKDDEDAAEYVHNLRRQSRFTPDEPGQS